MPACDLDASELERLEHVDQLGHVLVKSEPHGTALVVADHEVDVSRPALLCGRPSRLGSLTGHASLEATRHTWCHRRNVRMRAFA